MKKGKSVADPRHPTVVRRSRDARLAELNGVGPFLRAYLRLVDVRCGRPTCHCATGKGHPSHYLVVKQDGKTQTRYVRKDRLDEVRGWLKQYKRVRRLVQEISDLTLELLVSEAHAARQEKRRKRPS
jgi:hypothetical protein